MITACLCIQLEFAVREYFILKKSVLLRAERVKNKCTTLLLAIDLPVPASIIAKFLAQYNSLPNFIDHLAFLHTKLNSSKNCIQLLH